MFGRKNKLRHDLPAIDIRHKPKKGFFGKVKLVPTTKHEQRRMKAKLMRQYPDRYFADDLNEWNSVKPNGDLDLIDTLEMLDAIFDD